MATIQEGSFKVTTIMDADGHLSIYVESTDGPVFEVDGDFGGDSEFSVRLSTEKIESAS